MYMPLCQCTGFVSAPSRSDLWKFCTSVPHPASAGKLEVHRDRMSTTAVTVTRRLVILALASSMGMVSFTLPVESTQALQVQFTGRVDVDFPVGPGVFVATDATSDVSFPHPASPLDPYGPRVDDPTGWNINDVRFAYDSVTDTAYFGKRCGHRVWCCGELGGSVEWQVAL